MEPSLSSRDPPPMADLQGCPRKPSAAHPPSLPSHLRSSNGSHTYVGQTHSGDPAPYRADVSMEDNEDIDHHSDPGTSAPSTPLNDVRRNRHGAPKKAPHGQFPGKLRAMLEDEAMKDYIVQCKVEDSDGLSIPDIEAFAENALPKHFPDMNKHWGSFQKQLSNYGFRKQVRDKTKGLYVRSDKKICRDRPYPLPEVGRQAKAAKPQQRVQEQPRAANTPAVPQPPVQLDPYVRIYHLEKKLEKTTSELEATRNEVSELAERLEAMEALVQSMLHQPGAMPIGNSSSNPEVCTGPAGGAVDKDYSLHRADDPSGINYDAFVPNPPVGAHDDGALQGVPSYMVMEMTHETIDLDPPPQQPPVPQPPTDSLFAGPPPTFPHAAGQPTVEVPAPQGSWTPSYSSPTFWDRAFVLLQEVGLAAVGQSSASNTPATASTSQAPAPPQSSNSIGTFGGRNQFGGMYPVPPRRR